MGQNSLSVSRLAQRRQPVEATQQAPRLDGGEQPRSRRRRLHAALIDPRPLIRAALAQGLRVVRRDSDFVLFDSAADFLRLAPTLPEVELVIVSARAAEVVSGAVFEVVRELCVALPGKRVIIISDGDEAEAVTATIKVGGRAYISTSLDLRVARAALDVVLAGGTFAPATSLLHEAPALTPPAPNAGLLPAPESAPEGETVRQLARCAQITAREAQVLACVARGCSNKVIARELNLREGTVKVHLRSLMTKLDAANRTQLALRVAHQSTRPSS